MESRIINGIRVFAPVSRDELIEHALAKHSLLVAVNAEKILHATDRTREIINRNVGYPDGIGAVMALKSKGVQNTVKIPGVELWLDIVRRCYGDKRFYLVGGRQPVIERVVGRLREEFPGISIVNHRNGYLGGEEEQAALVDDVVDKAPDVVFVAMGSPRQELLMEAMRSRHPALYQGLGGSFDVYAGEVERAPDWWVSHHLEWAYRLVKQPSRIKRQIHLVRFLGRLIFNRL